MFKFFITHREKYGGKKKIIPNALMGGEIAVVLPFEQCCPKVDFFFNQKLTTAEKGFKVSYLVKIKVSGSCDFSHKPYADNRNI